MATKVETPTIQPEEEGHLVVAGRVMVRAVLEDLMASGLFLNKEMDLAIAADFKFIESSKKSLTITWWNEGDTEDDKRVLHFEDMSNLEA